MGRFSTPSEVVTISTIHHQAIFIKAFEGKSGDRMAPPDQGSVCELDGENPGLWYNWAHCTPSNGRRQTCSNPC